MSLVENLVNQISGKQLGGVTKPIGFDMNDTTFAELLKKNMMQSPEEIQETTQISGIGAPAGFIIEPYGTDNNITATQTDNTPVEIKDVDFGSDYFSNLLKTEPKNHTDLMNFAKKQASNVYNMFGKNVITTLSELAGDIAGIT